MRNLFTRANRALVSFVVVALLGAAALAADKPFSDVPGGTDHALIKRYTGSTLIGAKVADWGQAVMPLGLPQDANKDLLAAKKMVEGQVTRLVYLAPVGKAPLEVFRNHQQALDAAGFKTLYACDRDCAYLYFAWSKADAPYQGLAWSNGAIRQAGGDGRYNVDAPLSHDDARMLVGTITQGGQDLSVLLYTSAAVNPGTKQAATYITIVAPKAMPTGQVTVDASAMQSGLQTDGKVALYGLFFETGKADVKAESKPQLDQMAKLLQAQPTLKVLIVGHTDNQGAIDANLSLSQRRAQAVVDALAKGYAIDVKRLIARGVANLAPVASNAAEAGRAKNRRVELVLP